jgi:hypothetical protein
MEGIGEVPFDSLRWEEFYRRVMEKGTSHLIKKIRGGIFLQHGSNLLTQRGSEGSFDQSNKKELRHFVALKYVL